MLLNYLKVGIRNILKYKAFSFINIFGLAVAMSVSMLIILMLADQQRYDQFHTKKDRIYRILSNYEGSRQPYATSPYPLAQAIRTEYGIAEEATTLTPGVGGDVTYGQKLADLRGYFAEPAFFSIFSFDLATGDKATALSKPYSMIISQEIAAQLFGAEDPIGKVVEFSDRQLPFPIEVDGVGGPAVPWGSFTITGVIDESQYTSHLKFDALVSSATRQSLIAESKMVDLSNNWEWYYRSYTYVLLDESKSAEDLSAALTDLAKRKYADLHSDQTKGFKLIPQPLSEVALGLSGNDTNNRMPGVAYYILSALALVILISACLNYASLSIARALTRAKEIGVRKVTGAARKNLVVQFLSESALTSLAAMAMAVFFLLLLAPAFKGLWVNQYLNFELSATPAVYLAFLGFALVIGLIAGLYPAFYLSGQRPIQALKNLGNASSGKLGLRKLLGVLQFVISLFFITTTILIYNQFRHFLHFDYGFNADNVVNIELQGADYQKLANELQGVAGVTTISACDIVPASGRSNNYELKRADRQEDFFKAGSIMADRNFTDNLGIELVTGRNFGSGETPEHHALVNEAMVRKLGYGHPSEIIGEVLESKWGNAQFEVIGVVKDFRYRLLLNEDKIEPLVLRHVPAKFEYLNVKLSTTDLQGTLKKLDAAWKKIDPLHPFKYEFFDEQLEATHSGIFDVVSILGFIAFLAIVIACLGLLGMVIYTAERKTKEVGIRKILGAETLSIAFLLSKGFLGMLLLSILIGAPLSYFANNLWLEKFPNRVEFGPGTVLLGVAVLFTLGLLTIGSQTWRSSRANPVDALKIE